MLLKPTAPAPALSQSKWNSNACLLVKNLLHNLTYTIGRRVVVQLWGKCQQKIQLQKGTRLIFDLKVNILFFGYDLTIKYGLHLELSSQKMDLETMRAHDLPISNQHSTTELTHLCVDMLIITVEIGFLRLCQIVEFTVKWSKHWLKQKIPNKMTMKLFLGQKCFSHICFFLSFACKTIQ